MTFKFRDSFIMDPFDTNMIQVGKLDKEVQKLILSLI